MAQQLRDLLSLETLRAGRVKDFNAVSENNGKEGKTIREGSPANAATGSAPERDQFGVTKIKTTKAKDPKNAMLVTKVAAARYCMDCKGRHAAGACTMKAKKKK